MSLFNNVQGKAMERCHSIELWFTCEDGCRSLGVVYSGKPNDSRIGARCRSSTTSSLLFEQLLLSQLSGYNIVNYIGCQRLTLLCNCRQRTLFPPLGFIRAFGDR